MLYKGWSGAGGFQLCSRSLCVLRRGVYSSNGCTTVAGPSVCRLQNFINSRNYNHQGCQSQILNQQQRQLSQKQGFQTLLNQQRQYQTLKQQSSRFQYQFLQNQQNELFQRQSLHSRGGFEHPPEPAQKLPFYKRISKQTKLAVGLGFLLGGALIYWDRSNNKKNECLPGTKGESPILRTKPPEHAVARSILNPKDATGLRLTLYQYQTCPFCCKVRAFLDYYGFSYDVVEVNSVTRTQTKWTSYRKVPFILLELPGSDGHSSTVVQMKDSSVIISFLASVLRNPRDKVLDIVQSYPSQYNDEGKLEFSNAFNVMYGETVRPYTSAQIKEEMHWRRWVDNFFVHVLSPNVYRTPLEALRSFDWFSQVGEWERLFPTWERLLVVYLGAVVMWVIGKMLKVKYGIESEPRESLYKGAQTFVSAIDKTKGPFVGGARPNLADLNMYGVLTAIEGCEAFKDLMAQDREILGWFLEMRERVKGREGEGELVRRCAVR